jgi:hypothetical protein
MKDEMDEDIRNPEHAVVDELLPWYVNETLGAGERAKVRAEYDQAIADTNVDIGEHNSAEAKVAAVAAAARAKALAEAAQAKGDKHPASQEQAEALNRISRRAP